MTPNPSLAVSSAENNNTKSTPHSSSSSCDLEHVQLKFVNCSELLRKLDHLVEGSDRIRKYFHEYDFEPATPGNGHRSFVLIVERLVKLLSSDEVDQRDGCQLLEVDKILDFFTEILSAIERLRASKELGKIFSQDLDFNKELLKWSLALKEDMKFIYGRYSNFWVCPSIRMYLKAYATLVSLLWKPWSAHRILWDTGYVARTFSDYALNARVSFVSSVWNIAEYRFYKTLIPLALYGWRVTPQTFFVSPSTSWKVWKDSQLTYEAPKRIRQIRCRYLSYKFESSNDVLVFHVHGAGFIAQHPDSHDTYLRDWVIKLKTVPILSIDYSLAPDNKFPVAVQEVLDMYLWVTGSSVDVVSTIGFRPKRIIFLGDSVGASLCLSLVIVVNDIRRAVLTNRGRSGDSASDADFLPPLPETILSMYPCTNMNYETSASKLFCSFETFLTTGVILDISKAYVPIDESGPNFKLDASELTPWYRRSDALEELDRINESTCHPYLSPIYYEHFEDLKTVNLILVAPQFDALLDDSIALARVWRGKVTLDIIEDLPHGFNYFFVLSSEAKKAADLCADRLVQASQRL